jgi:hypothetical protein
MERRFYLGFLKPKIKFTSVQGQLKNKSQQKIHKHLFWFTLFINTQTKNVSFAEKIFVLFQIMHKMIIMIYFNIRGVSAENVTA